MNDLEKYVRTALDDKALPSHELWQLVLTKADTQVVSLDGHSSHKASSNYFSWFTQIAAAACVAVVALSGATSESFTASTAAERELTEFQAGWTSGSLGPIDEDITWVAVTGDPSFAVSNSGIAVDRGYDISGFLQSGYNVVNLADRLESTGITLRDVSLTPAYVSCQLTPQPGLRIAYHGGTGSPWITPEGFIRWKIAEDFDSAALEQHCESLLAESKSFRSRIRRDPRVPENFTLDFTACISPLRPLQVSVYPTIRGLNNPNAICADNDSYPLRDKSRTAIFELRTQVEYAMYGVVFQPPAPAKVSYPGFSQFP